MITASKKHLESSLMKQAFRENAVLPVGPMLSSDMWCSTLSLGEEASYPDYEESYPDSQNLTPKQTSPTMARAATRIKCRIGIRYII